MTAAVVIGVALGVLAFWWVHRRILSGRPFRVRVRAKPRIIHVVLRPPPPRFGVPGPCDLEALVRSLEAARLGEVRRSRGRAGALIVRTADGDEVRVRAQGKTEGIVLADLEVEASSDELCALVLDAIAPRVGPMEVALDGVPLFIDGTTPHETLLRTLHDRRMERQARAEHRPARRELH